MPTFLIFSDAQARLVSELIAQRLVALRGQAPDRVVWRWEVEEYRELVALAESLQRPLAAVAAEPAA